jgi:hypothetical protein
VDAWDDDETSRPSPRRKEELDDVAPICAAFWSSAVADMCGDGDGGGARCCCRSDAAGAEKSEEEASVARHSGGGLLALSGWYCGATEEGGERCVVRDELVGEEEGAIGGGGGAVEARDGGVVAVAKHGAAEDGERVAVEVGRDPNQ